MHIVKIRQITTQITTGSCYLCVNAGLDRAAICIIDETMFGDVRQLAAQLNLSPATAQWMIESGL